LQSLLPQQDPLVYFQSDELAKDEKDDKKKEEEIEKAVAKDEVVNTGKNAKSQENKEAK